MVDHKSASSTTTHSNGLFSRRPSFFGRRSKAHHASPSLSAARSTPTPPPPPALAPVPAPAPTPAPAAASATPTATNTTTTSTSAAANLTPAPAPAPGPTSAPTNNAIATPAVATAASSTTSAESGPPPVHSLLPTYYNSPPRASTVLKRQRSQTTRHSIASSVSDLGSQLRRSRSASLRTNNSGGTASTSSHKRTPSATFTTITRASTRDSSPDKHSGPNAPSTTSRPILSVSTFTRNRKASTDGLNDSPISAIDKPKTHFAMAVPMPVRFPPSEKNIPPSSLQSSGRALGPAAPIPIPLPNASSPHVVFQQIHELASKRISTLDYLRKAHEGRIYWFNTLLFSKTDLTRLPSFTSRNQARRATHYLLLGFSLPNILDLHNNSAVDYLKALNAILLEFETYQSIHPADGSGPSSLSRARIPQMFKRANLNMGGKGRRSSSATGDFPTLTPSNSFTGSDPMSIDSPPNEDLLLPNESYLYLQTPSLPFEPDFFSTFATLCDVLIDCYTKMLSMLSTPESVATAGGGVPSTVGDLFTKADTRVRKILLAGVVREFEESCRAGLKSEVGGVGKVVLGGLM